MNDLTQYIKTAFEYKNEGRYKEAIDYFYKAFSIDNDSYEIMCELAYLYSKLNQNDRAVSFCEQILAKNENDFEIRFFMASLYRKNGDYQKSKEQLLILFETKKDIEKTAEELFNVLIKCGEYDKIIDIYNENKDVLSSSIIYYYVGKAYLEIKDKSKAEEYFKKSFEFDKSNVESGSRVAEVLFDNGEYSEAENILTDLLKYAENDRIFYLLAELSYIKSNFDRAINYYILAIKLNDKNAKYYYKLGSAYTAKGFLSQAEESFCRAITIEPENILYNYTLAYLYFINKKYGLAMRLIDTVLSADENYQDAIVLKLQILVNENNITQAGKIVEKIKNSENKNERVYYALSQYYAKLNIWNKAIENIKEAIYFNNGSCDYNYELASYYYEIKEYEKAGKTCEKIIKVNDKYINAYILLSRICIAVNDNENAVKYIDTASKLDMNIPVIYFVKGILFEKRKDKQNALDNYKIAISMAPKNIKYYEAAAKCYYNFGDYESAYRYYKEASDIDVSNAEYHYYMAKCAEQRGDIETAVSSYSMARRLSPLNINYIEDYAKMLVKAKKKKQAVSVIKSSMKLLSGEDKSKLKQFLSAI